jgi:hypothetical protein
MVRSMSNSDMHVWRGKAESNICFASSIRAILSKPERLEREERH